MISHFHVAFKPYCLKGYCRRRLGVYVVIISFLFTNDITRPFECAADNVFSSFSNGLIVISSFCFTAWDVYSVTIY